MSLHTQPSPKEPPPPRASATSPLRASATSMESPPPSRGKTNRIPRQILLWSILIALMIWLPRGLALDQFVTADEHAWLARSGNFYRAIANQDFGGTFQRHHPGVTVTWAGTLGFLTTYPNYAKDAPKEFGWLTEEIEPFLESQSQSAIDMLAAGRQFIVFFITLALMASFWLTWRLLGSRAALIGMGIIAFAPFHVGLSRLMHLDGLLSSFMLLSLLAYLAYIQTDSGSRIGYLLLSGAAAGLAWLTRSPGLFLAPFLGLVMALTVMQERLEKQVRQAGPAQQSIWWEQTRQLILQLLLWAAIGGVVFVLLWPAMWVAPFQSVAEVLNAARNYAAEGHLKPTFFNGQVISGDPGSSFYPVSYLWRTTPVTLIGLALGMVGLLLSAIRSNASGHAAKQRNTLLTLLLFGLLFGLFINLGDKKFDRYLLPAYLPLALVAGWGWAWLAGLFSRFAGSPELSPELSPETSTATSTATSPAEVPKAVGPWVSSVSVPSLIGGVVIVAQAAFSLPTFPYYLSYYNPLVGGAAEAPKVMQIGWGEGADKAATALNEELEKNDVAPSGVRVASAYTNGPFSYFFAGTTLPIYFWHQADYAVVYAQDFQRRLPGPRQIRYFEERTPLKTVRLNGLTYAQLYDLQSAPLPAYVTDWQSSESSGPQIRLVSYLFPSSRIAPGQTLPMTLYFENLAPIETDLSVLVRLTDADGTEIARSEGWPQGRPTSKWLLGDTWADGHTLEFGQENENALGEDSHLGSGVDIYRLDVSFYNSETLERLTATRPLTNELLGDTLHLDFVQIGTDTPPPAQPFTPAYTFGNLLELRGTTWIRSSQDAGGGAISEGLLMPETDTIAAGEALTVHLDWRTLAHIDRDYTTFVHIMGPDGTPLTQTDQQPWGGFYPTRFWSPGREVRQPITLAIPEDAAPGSYVVHVGMYDSETVTRLPVSQDREPVGDSVIVAAITVGG